MIFGNPLSTGPFLCMPHILTCPIFHQLFFDHLRKVIKDAGDKML